MLFPSLMLLRYILSKLRFLLILCKLGSGSCHNILEITGPNSHQGKQEKNEDEEMTRERTRKMEKVAFSVFSVRRQQ